MGTGGDSAAVTRRVDRTRAPGGLGRALRAVRDPFLFGVLPFLFAVGTLRRAHEVIGVVGFDFRGTLWVPARALLDGAPLYPEPTRAAIELGNPAVYPPISALLAVPVAVLPVGVASVVWAAVLAAGVGLALWLVDVRDWRCYAVAMASAPVLDGVYVGNLTLLLVVPLALAWRYRARPLVAGLAVGAAVAAKLFVWPLLVWLVLTRRFRAAGVAAAAAAAFVLGPWALLGWEGLADYPALLGELQEVYATRNLSLATVAGALGASVDASVAIGTLGGLVLLGAAGLSARRPAGELPSFALAVAACVVATPIAWLNYWALLLVPIAIRWPRLSPAWAFGYAVVLAKYLPGIEYQTPEPCCRPPGVPEFIWDVNHGVAAPWQGLALLGALGVLTAAIVWRPLTAGRRPSGSPEPPRRPT